MRVKIPITTGKVPIIFRQRVLAFIKEALAQADKDYKESMYNVRMPKAYTFNLAFDRTNPKEEEISLDEKFKIKDKVFYQDRPVFLYISSNDYQFLINLFNGMKKIKIFDFNKFDNIYWQVGKPVILREKIIFNDEVTFKTNAPFIIETKDDRPVVFSDENFQTELNNVMERIFRKLDNRGLKQPLEFYPINMKKEVIKHTLRGFREKTGKPIMYITGNSGIFKLKGHPEDLQTIYQIGLGNRTGQGFGMVEVFGG
jgi:CRISPR-associated endoribonuclease Cas6